MPAARSAWGSLTDASSALWSSVDSPMRDAFRRGRTRERTGCVSLASPIGRGHSAGPTPGRRRPLQSQPGPPRKALSLPVPHPHNPSLPPSHPKPHTPPPPTVLPRRAGASQLGRAERRLCAWGGVAVRSRNGRPARVRGNGRPPPERTTRKTPSKTGVKPFSAPTKTLNTPGGRKKIILEALGRWQPQLEDFAALGARMPFDGAAFPRAGGTRSGTAPRRTQGGTRAPRGRGRRLTVRGRGERGAWGCARARRGGVGERGARGLISGVRGGLAPCPRRISVG